MHTLIKRMFRSYNGRHYTSRWARKLFDHASARRHVGYTLAGFVFMGVVLQPKVYAMANDPSALSVPPPPIILEELSTETTLTWPVAAPRITQGFHSGHTGLDMQDAESGAIYPVDKGWVSLIVSSAWGYGNHLFVYHPNGRSSLYAHMARIDVQEGQEVSRDTVLGQMGSTGWSTGVHLHLEIFENNERLDPLAVLPENEKMTILSLSAYTATPSATPSTEATASATSQDTSAQTSSDETSPSPGIEGNQQ